MKKYGAITSSTDPEEIATRIKGITLAMSSVIIYMAARFFNVTVSANGMISLATELGAVSGAVATLYGAGMALWVRFFKTA